MGGEMVTGHESILSNEERDVLHDVGYEQASDRAATGVLADRAMRLAQSNDPGVVLIPLADALREFEFVQDLMFGLVAPDANDDIAQVAEDMEDPLGHFLWVRSGAKVRLPVQLFTLLETPQARQFTHDVTLIDEGAEVELVSGAAAPSAVHRGRHVSVSETYLRPGARMNTVSLEHWGTGMDIRSYGYTRLEEGAQCYSTSVMLSPIAEHSSVSESVLLADAISVAQAVLFAPEGSERVLRSNTYLKGTGAVSEDIARMVSAGGSIANEAFLYGEAAGASGFLGCDGLKLTDMGDITAVPSLVARAEGAQLSHEASVGMIDSAKLDYLMAAGFDEDLARDLIVQGFLALDDEKIPAATRRRVAEMIARAKSGGM